MSCVRARILPADRSTVDSRGGWSRGTEHGALLAELRTGWAGDPTHDRWADWRLH